MINKNIKLLKTDFYNFNFKYFWKVRQFQSIKNRADSSVAFKRLAAPMPAAPVSYLR